MTQVAVPGLFHLFPARRFWESRRDIHFRLPPL